MKVALERIRLSPAVGAALLAVALFAALSHGDIGGSTPAVYKSVAGSVPPAPNVDTVSKAGATATCDPGQQVIGGGAQVDDPQSVFAVDGYPDAGNTAWTVHVSSDDVKNVHRFTVTAICAASGATGPTGPTGPSGPAGPAGP